MRAAANLAVQRWRWREPAPWFAALFAAVALLYLFPMSWLQTMPLAARGFAGGLLTGLPVGIAGVIVPMLLARAVQPVAALGSNLLGAVLGGCLEYYSMLGGLKSTALMALVCISGHICGCESGGPEHRPRARVTRMARRGPPTRDLVWPCDLPRKKAPKLNVTY